MTTLLICLGAVAALMLVGYLAACAGAERWLPLREWLARTTCSHAQGRGGNYEVKAAYADPPYLGLAEAFYGKMHPEAAEYDKPETHQRLIDRLMDEYDCWAMSLHEPALREILNMCPKDVRVAAWVKPFASFKKNVTRAWTWEPVIFSFHRARKRTIEQPTWRDHIAEPIAMLRGFPGAKPDKFCFWVFEGLNLQPDDEFHDLFHGSGAVGRAWEKWKQAHQRPEQYALEAC